MAPASKNTGGIPFIVSTGTKKPDPEVRRFIRSHVMIGKNRGKTLLPRKKKKAGPSTAVDSNGDNSTLDRECSEASLATATLDIIPQKVGSDLSFIHFADRIDESAIAVILQFSSIAKKALFPLESCINFGAKEKAWMEALTVDAAYLHAMAFSAQDYFDLLPGRPTSCRNASARLAAPHVVKTLQLLRERLEMSEEHDMKMVQGSFSTAAVVLCLAFHAHIMGEQQAALHHMQGLRKIIDLSGGLQGLENNMKLLLEVLRCDIGMALHYGSRPLFFANLAREPYWPYPDFTSYSPVCSSALESCKLICGLDPELFRAWEVTKQFSTLVNHAASRHQKLPKEYLLDTMVSVMYPILHMSSDSFERSSLDEAIRLGLLAYCSSVFLQWAGVRLPYMHFPTMYRNCLFNLQLPELDVDSDSSSSSPLLLWLLMIGAVSVFGDCDDVWLKPWLHVNMELCGVGDSWDAMRDVLNSFMWIGLVHDIPGKAVFDSTLSLDLSLELHE
ncbi:hypothetical protein F4818DRAFT_420316 [Hypoxylon cercidicola]|nr:hypothetical protein F4818DRAFT_420316 [Hypoxylon cercidicola]